MRFATKFDRWLTVAMGLAAFVTFVCLPAIRLLWPNAGVIPLPVVFLPWAIWIFVLASTLPQYYEVRDDGLFLRQGIRKTLIPWPSLVELQTMTDFRSAGVFSTDRILVVTREAAQFIIAPADRQGFLEQVARHTPQLEQKSFGLALPLSSPTAI